MNALTLLVCFLKNKKRMPNRQRAIMLLRNSEYTFTITTRLSAESGLPLMRVPIFAIQ